MQALREHSAALETYIAGRRAWWDEAQAAQIDLAKRVAALEHELALTTQQLDDAAALSTRESERATALRTQLVDFARRLEASERELRAARGDVAPAVIGPSTAVPPSATGVTAPPIHPTPPPSPHPTPAPVANADVDSGLSQGIEAIAQLEAEVGYKRQQVAAQLIELRDREQRLTALTTETERLRQHVATTQAELQQSRSDVARLERAILDKDRALQVRDMRIATLQSELDQRLGAMQKLGAMDASLQGLHSRMSEQLRMTEQSDVHSPELICLTGDAPKRFALTKRSVTVGRSPRCDLQIVTHFVSREHARISVVENAAVIEDLGSRNGVFVNAVKVSRQRLQQGDLITIGETQFRFIESAAH
jgi:predicted  nucleic acid-binding Zn-ribbon protein